MTRERINPFILLQDVIEQLPGGEGQIDRLKYQNQKTLIQLPRVQRTLHQITPRVLKSTPEKLRQILTWKKVARILLGEKRP